jgi:hypothetical protein
MGSRLVLVRVLYHIDLLVLFNSRQIPKLLKVMPESAGPLDNTSVSLYSGNWDEMVLYNATTKERYVSIDGSKPESPWIRSNRTRLRSWLLSELNVNWNQKYEKHEVQEDGTVKVYFEGGHTTTGDILVGADGVSSHGKRSPLF